MSEATQPGVGKGGRNDDRRQRATIARQVVVVVWPAIYIHERAV